MHNIFNVLSYGTGAILQNDYFHMLRVLNTLYHITSAKSTPPSLSGISFQYRKIILAIRIHDG